MNDINIIIWYYQVTATEAYKILSMLSDEELELIREEYEKEGIY